MASQLYLIIQAGFIFLTIVYLGLFIREIWKGIALTSFSPARKKGFLWMMITAALLWAAFIAGWSLTGTMSDFSLFPLNLLPVILIPLIAVVILMNSRVLAGILNHIPADNLIRLQSFRVFVEILLWLLFTQNLLPVQMTFDGTNLDILAGLTAPAIAFLAFRGAISRKALLIWNFLCLGLLLNIVITAVLSTPSPWRVFMNEPANYIVTIFPVSLLPGFLVPLAYYLHLFSIKQLLLKKTLVSARGSSRQFSEEK